MSPFPATKTLIILTKYPLLARAVPKPGEFRNNKPLLYFRRSRFVPAIVPSLSGRRRAHSHSEFFAPALTLTLFFALYFNRSTEIIRGRK